MQLSDSQTALEAGQLVIAGLTLGLGVDEALAWWRERSSSLRWMALTSFALVAVLAANVAVVAATRGSIADAALFARAVALSVATVFVVIMASSVGGRKTPHWVLARQGALADLSHHALTRPLWELCDEVEDGLRSSLPADRCEVTLDSSAVAVESRPGRLAVPVPGSFGPNGAVCVVREEPFDNDDLAFLEAAAHLLGGARDRYRAEEQIRHQALHDDLTGLANRMLIRDRLSSAVRNASRVRERVAVMLLDVDGFKSINDIHGHPAGDNVLWQLSRRISETLQEGETLGRFGGDEFVVICEGIPDDAAVADIAARLLATSRQPVDVPTGQTRVSASVGIVVSASGDDADTLLRDADIAMRRAKERGGDTAEVFNLTLRRQVLMLVDMQEALAFAVDLGEIVAYYQPIIELQTGRVVRLEALARWRRGDALIPPAEWVPIAEHTGAIGAIGCEMLRQATTQLARWLKTHPDLVVAVNVSPRQLSGSELVQCVEEAIALGLPPDRLCLEVTERIAVDDA